tara:strand:+ start:1051 stop:1263 length:213 start_codon:yes stop_codon:yes gene_type:complete
MTTRIHTRLEQLKGIRTNLSLSGSQHVEKSSYMQMIDMNIEALTDIVTLIDAVNNNESEKVEAWFQRFKV